MSPTNPIPRGDTDMSQDIENECRCEPSDYVAPAGYDGDGSVAAMARRAAMVVPLTVANAPIGTKAPACIGGYWIKVERGWMWCTGSTFPRPGGDWTGELIPPEPAAFA